MVWWFYAPQWNPFLADTALGATHISGIDAAFEDIAQHNPQASCLWTPSEGFYQFSRNWHQITGQLPRDCMGQQWLEYWDRDARMAFDEALSSLFATRKDARPESCILDAQMVHGLGHLITLQLALLPSGLNGEHKATLLVSDVTEQRRLKREAEAAQRHSETLAHCRSSFLSNMSHELRTPLNAILGFAQMLELGSLQEEDKAREYLQHIRVSGEDLLNKISDLIELANIDAGEARLEDSPINVRELIAAAVETQSHRAFERGITLHQERGKPHLVIRADKPKLLHSLSHLLSEAISHSPENGIIVISYSADAKQGLVITVHHRGAGYSAQRLENLRQSLTVERSYYHTDIHDMSIGLSICKEMIELHEGSLSIDSMAGRGTICTLCLPAKRIISFSAQVKPKQARGVASSI